jgi:hypothetical protein
MASIGLGILSWNDPLSLEGALKSYQREGFLELFDEALICFQEISDRDRALADEFGVPYKGFDTNLGIYGGFKRLAEALTSEYILLVENDCPLAATRSEAERQINLALKDFEAGRVHQFRFRHRWKPGQKFQHADKYRRYFQPEDDCGRPGTENLSRASDLHQWLRPFKRRRLRGGAMYVERHPERVFPEVIERREGGHFIVDSSVMNWTNQSILVSREFYLNVILKRVETHPSSKPLHGFQDVERALRSRWWRSQHFKIGVADPGLFTHHRIDPEGEE